MSASPCPDVEVVLGYADARLDAAAREQLEAHLDTCETCGELVVHALREISRPSAPSHASTASRVDSQRVGPHAVETSEMPDTIGRYLVIGQVGAGGMGSVWSAIDPRLQRTVAIKLLDRKTSGDDDERSMQEARALARLAHPNVVAVFEVGPAAGRRCGPRLRPRASRLAARRVRRAW